MEKSSAEEREEMSKERDALQLQIEQLLKHEEMLQAKVRVLSTMLLFRVMYRCHIFQ